MSMNLTVLCSTKTGPISNIWPLVCDGLKSKFADDVIPHDLMFQCGVHRNGLEGGSIQSRSHELNWISLYQSTITSEDWSDWSSAIHDVHAIAAIDKLSREEGAICHFCFEGRRTAREMRTLFIIALELARVVGGVIENDEQLKLETLFVGFLTIEQLELVIREMFERPDWST